MDRTERIDVLRARIAAGSYVIDVHAIAMAIVARVLARLARAGS